jgi:hypothetical protein
VYNIRLFVLRFRFFHVLFKPNCVPLSSEIFRMICYVKDREIRIMNWYLVLLFSFLGSEIKSISRKYLITFKSYTNKGTENSCPGFPPLKNTVLPRFRVSNVNIFSITYIKLKPLISSLLWNLHHENMSFRSKVIPINVLENTCPGIK